MPAMEVRLFGKFCVLCNEKIVVGLQTRKVSELFCYLLLNRNRPHPREALAALLWEECSTAQSKSYLRKALWQLQSALAFSNIPAPAGGMPPDSRTYPESAGRDVVELLQVEPDWIQLNLQPDLWFDVAFFEQAFTASQGVRGSDIDAACASRVQDAVALYQGDLLEGWYQDWCLYERERLQNMYLAMLDKLMVYCEVQHDYETGIAHGMQILRYDLARERTHQRLMRLYFLSGDRTAALRQFERCAAILEKELHVTPDPITLRLCEQIRANHLDDAGGNPPPAPPALSTNEAGTRPLHEVLGRLKEFQESLLRLHNQIEDEIQALEQVLKAPQ
ncbi:MAG: hypothetical protein HY326_11095 [Chloroflexi bacterium]|nr:hypothetical protein [Chloroflexota bacterium]